MVALVIRRPAPPALQLSWTAPTDFLLDVPGTELLRETPSFTLKGPLP